jgi:hypothetical protein
MVAKNQEIKRERKRAKREKIDKTVNGYMINLAWGIFVIILLRFVETGYSSGDTVLQMPVIMKVLAGVFGLGAAALFVCGGLNVLNQKSRFVGYGVFVLILAFGSLWIGFFPQIRNLMMGINPGLADVDSRWWISRGPIVLVAAYLVLTLVLTAVKITLIEKGKKL